MSTFQALLCERASPEARVRYFLYRTRYPSAHVSRRIPWPKLLAIMSSCAIIWPMRKLSPGIWILASAMVLSAAQYRMKTVKILPIESYPARATAQGITVAADPYDTDRKSYRAFDVRKLNSRGYFPIHIIVENNTQDFIKVQARNIILVTASGQHLYTTPTTIIVEDIAKAGSAGRTSQTRGGSTATSGTEGSPQSDFASKELTNLLVDPGTVSGGFLFFFTDKPEENLFAGSTLYIPKLESEGGKRTFGPFSIPLDAALSPPGK